MRPARIRQPDAAFLPASGCRPSQATALQSAPASSRLRRVASPTAVAGSGFVAGSLRHDGAEIGERRDCADRSVHQVSMATVTV